MSHRPEAEVIINARSTLTLQMAFGSQIFGLTVPGWLFVLERSNGCRTNKRRTGEVD